MFFYCQGRVTAFLASSNPVKCITQAQYPLSLHGLSALEHLISDLLRRDLLCPLGCQHVGIFLPGLHPCAIVFTKTLVLLLFSRPSALATHLLLGKCHYRLPAWFTFIMKTAQVCQGTTFPFRAAGSAYCAWLGRTKLSSI